GQEIADLWDAHAEWDAVPQTASCSPMKAQKEITDKIYTLKSLISHMEPVSKECVLVLLANAGDIAETLTMSDCTGLAHYGEARELNRCLASITRYLSNGGTVSRFVEIHQSPELSRRIANWGNIELPEAMATPETEQVPDVAKAA
ncbi:MAG: hypothetical protein AAF468_19410, partial [Pseudomonadota bacterium]